MVLIRVAISMERLISEKMGLQATQGFLASYWWQTADMSRTTVFHSMSLST